MTLSKTLALIVSYQLIFILILGGLQSCTVQDEDPCSELREQVSDLIEDVNSLLIDQQEPSTEPSAEPAGADIQIDFFIYVVAGVSAELKVFEDASCTVELGSEKEIGIIEQGTVSLDMYHFWLKNTGEVDLTISLATGSTPFGNAYLCNVGTGSTQSFNLLVGESVELAVFVTVVETTEEGQFSFSAYLTGELLEA